MKKSVRCLSFFISYKLMLILLALYAVLLAVATFIESRYGSPAARAVVYNNVLFYLLQLLLIINFVGISLKVHYGGIGNMGLLYFIGLLLSC